MVNDETYTYDENGNLVGRAGEALVYDAENRLQAVTTSTGVTVTFTYDAEGRRVVRKTAMQTVAYAGRHYELHTIQKIPEILCTLCRERL